jgi:hypothetical protein
MGFADAGGVADLSSTPTPLGVFLPPAANAGSYSYVYNSGQLTAPDTSLGRSFFALIGSTTSGNQLMFRAFDQKSYQMTDTISVPLPSSFSTSTGSPLVDAVRWGVDGLAVLRSDGQISVIRGPFVVPALLAQNGSASLSAVSNASLAHGSGNVTLTITGSGFVPGVAVQWNGGYRTTTLVDAAHLTVAIPASDLQSAGTASITAVNPGAAASNALTETIN